MLVLSRKHDEVIVIDGVIRIRVLEIRGDKVRLGIDAPRDMPVHRQEVWARMLASSQPDLESGVPGEAESALRRGLADSARRVC